MPYNYSSTSSGQGNWNTGGSRTGTGSFDRGIVGTNSRYDVAPNNQQQMAAYQQQIAARNAAQRGGAGVQSSAPASAPPTAQVPIRRPNWGMGILQQLLRGISPQGPAASKTRGLGILNQMFGGQNTRTKQDYSRMPEYDRVGGYGNQSWNPPNPQWTSDPSLRNRQFVPGGFY